MNSQTISSTPTPQTRSVLSTLMLASAAINAGNGVLFALVAELQKVHGLSTAQLGWMSGAFFLASLLGLITLAHLADRGHAKSLLVAALGCSAGSLLWIAVADSLWELVAARAIEGLSFAVFAASARAIASRIDPERIGANLGKLSAADIGGFVLGPVVGTALVHLGWLATPFFALSGLASVSFVLYLWFGPPDSHESKLELSWVQMSGFDLLRQRRIFGAALLALALFLPVGIYDSLWSKYLSDLGASRDFVGTSLTLYGLPIVLLAAFSGRLVDRIGAPRGMKLAMAGIAPITALYGLLPTYWLVAGVAMLEAVFNSLGGPASQTAMTKVCPPDRIAAGQGLSAVLAMSGAGIVGSLAPAIYASQGSGRLFGGVAILCLLLCALGLHLYRDASGEDGSVNPSNTRFKLVAKVPESATN